MPSSSPIGRRPLHVPVLIAGTIAMSACQDTIPLPTEVTAVPVQTRPVIPTNIRVTMDDSYAELADQVPGFGGMFYDEGGALNVYLKSPETAAAVRPQLAAFALQMRGSEVRHRRSSGSKART